MEVDLSDSNGFPSSYENISLEVDRTKASNKLNTDRNRTIEGIKLSGNRVDSENRANVSAGLPQENSKFQKTASERYQESKKQSPKVNKNNHSLGFPVNIRDNIIGIEDDSENYDELCQQVSNYDREEVEHFQNILKQTQLDMSNQKVPGSFSKVTADSLIKHSPKVHYQADSLKKDNNQKIQMRRKQVNKQFVLVDDEEEHNEFEEDLDFEEIPESSDGSYVEVSIEKEESLSSSFEKRTKSRKKYSKTFANNIAHDTFIKTQVKENMKPCLKKPNGHKRFRSPKVNLQRLQRSSSSESTSKKPSKFSRKHRRRSGKVEVPRSRDNSNEEETEILKQEYLKLKQQLLELQKMKSKQPRERSKNSRKNQTNRNKHTQEKKVTINPPKDSSNSK